MGIYHRLAAAVLVFSVACATQAAVRVPIKSVSRDVAVSTKSTATKGTDTVKTTVLEGEYIPGTNGRNTSIPIGKSLIQSIPRTITQARRVISLPDILLTGTIAGLVTGLDWVMGEGGTIQKKDYKPVVAAGKYCIPQPTPTCSSSAGQSTPKAAVDWSIADYNSRFPQYAPFTAVFTLNSAVSGSVTKIGDVAMKRSSGFVHGTVSLWYAGLCGNGFNQDGSCRSSEFTTLPLTSVDLDRIAPYVNGQTGSWIRDLMRESCAQSTSPDACLESLQEGGPELSGPASVQGPKETTTGTYTKSDGSTGTTKTEVNTTYNIKYGPTYIDVTTNKTVTNYKDGTKTDEQLATDGEEVTEEQPQEESEEDYSFQDSTLPEVEPFYQQKYPDGLSGVWNSAKSDFENSQFVSFMNSFVPNFSGTCPSWSMSFAIGALANFGTIPFQSLCYVFDFIKVIVLVTAVFSCRAIIFGG